MTPNGVDFSIRFLATACRWQHTHLPLVRVSLVPLAELSGDEGLGPLWGHPPPHLLHYPLQVLPCHLHSGV